MEVVVMYVMVSVLVWEYVHSTLQGWIAGFRCQLPVKMTQFRERFWWRSASLARALRG